MAHEIDYRLIGDDMQAVIVTLDPAETVVAEAGAMMYMQDDIDMNTSLDPSGSGSGLMGRLLKGAKRALAGDSFFVTTFTNEGRRRRDVAFAAPYPGKILPIDLRQWNGRIIAQKDAFLCAAFGVEVSIAFNRRIGAGFFGGEGFILQKIEGTGKLFFHTGGTIVPMQLAAGERLRVDTGCLAAFDPTVQYDNVRVGGIKTSLFGGEGLFFAAMTGPGRVWLQTLPFSRLADRIHAAYKGDRGEVKRDFGGVLGGLGDLIGGDR
jgi:uncharacterized protein (TIGR00266 family)